MITSHDFILAHHKRASDDIGHVRCAQLGSSDYSFFSLYPMDCDTSDHRVLKLDDISLNRRIHVGLRYWVLAMVHYLLKLTKMRTTSSGIHLSISSWRFSAWSQIDNMKRMLSKNDSPSGSSEFTDVCVYNFHCNSWRYLRREFPHDTFAYRRIGDIHWSIGVTLRSSTLGSMVCQGFSLPYVIVCFLTWTLKGLGKFHCQIGYPRILNLSWGFWVAAFA